MARITGRVEVDALRDVARTRGHSRMAARITNPTAVSTVRGFLPLNDKTLATRLATVPKSATRQHVKNYSINLNRSRPMKVTRSTVTYYTKRHVCAALQDDLLQNTNPPMEEDR